MWFQYLIPKTDQNRKALLQHIPTEELKTTIIICQETVYNSRRYKAFQTYIDLYNEINNTPESELLFHEVIVGYNLQKPRFDIDIKRSELPEELYLTLPKTY
jgi:hypothetical protein